MLFLDYVLNFMITDPEYKLSKYTLMYRFKHRHSNILCDQPLCSKHIYGELDTKLEDRGKVIFCFCKEHYYDIKKRSKEF